MIELECCWLRYGGLLGGVLVVLILPLLLLLLLLLLLSVTKRTDFLRRTTLGERARRDVAIGSQAHSVRAPMNGWQMYRRPVFSFVHVTTR